ncbi:MAG: hypothetical protein ACYDAK_06955 [Candidatus Limnocylindrales bacterium]
MADIDKSEGFKGAREAGEDDVEGHRLGAREGFMGAREAGEDDVEGHRHTLRSPSGHGE